MKKIGENIYEHNGIKLEAIDNAARKINCTLCPWTGKCVSKGFNCEKTIGNRVFRELKEKQMIKENVSFKCPTLIDERLFKLLAALERVGLKAGGVPAKGTVKFVYVGSNAVQFGADAWPFCDFDLPEVTLQQALDILATVHKPAPVFDVKFGCMILGRDNKNEIWEGGMFCRVNDNSYPFICTGDPFRAIVKYGGNEALLGTTDTPSGWWEARDGKPVWVTE